MAKQSAGILAYRLQEEQLQVLLVHPGGPLYARKDAGVWSIPKGEYDPGEDPFKVAQREFEEETGNRITTSTYIELSPVRLKSGKQIHAFAVAVNFTECFLRSNTFDMEWPPRSGRKQSFPEVDKAGWFSLPMAMEKIHPGQLPLLQQLQAAIDG